MIVHIFAIGMIIQILYILAAGPIGPEILAYDDNKFVIGVPFSATSKASINVIPGSIISFDESSKTFKNSYGDWKYSNKQQDDGHKYDHTGSSIVKGKFANDKDETFAVGAPKAVKLKGRVYICYECFKKDEEITEIIEGPKVGDRFGASLAAADLNGDGIDELIIGAPLYSSEVFQ